MERCGGAGVCLRRCMCEPPARPERQRAVEAPEPDMKGEIRALACALVLAAVQPSAAQQGPVRDQEEFAINLEELFTAPFIPINMEFAPPPVGLITVRREGDHVEFTAQVSALTTRQHMLHIHGFATTDPPEADCANEAADKNGDGIVDIIELRPVSGVILIPLTQEPASLNVKSGNYLRPGEDGKAIYTQTVDYKALKDALQERFGTEPRFGRRVVYLHGVPGNVTLPDSVQSLPGMPAQATVPVACADL